MKQPMRILLVDDDEEEWLLLKDLIAYENMSASMQVDWVGSYDQAIQSLNQCGYDAYLIDYHLGDRNGLDILKTPAAVACMAPIIMLTGQASYAVDLAAMEAGAADFLIKGQITYPLLERAIRYAIERKQIEKMLDQLVQARTRELVRANEELKSEIAVRKQTEASLRQAEQALHQANERLETQVAERTSQLKRRADELDALQRATFSLLTSLDPETLLVQILEGARQAIVTAENSCLYLSAERAGRLLKHYPAGPHEPRLQVLDPPIPPDHLLARVGDGKPLRLDDAPDPAPAGASPPVRSLIAAPLTLDEKVVGVLALEASQPEAFSEADLRLLSSFAATATAAIRNAVQHSELQNLATTDPLTGQLNRRALFDLGQRELDRFHRFGRPLAVILFDIDHFKLINDTYGHAAGDHALAEVIRRCSLIVRQVDILGRYGGDEFMVILTEADQPFARAVAERIRRSVEEAPVPSQAGAIQVSVSLGVALALPDTRQINELILRADQALYRAKRRGRNRVALEA